MQTPDTGGLAAFDTTGIAAGDTTAAAMGTTTTGISGTGLPPGATPTAGAGGASPAELGAQAVAARGWAPELSSRFMSNNDNVEGSADVRTTFADPSGIALTNVIGYAETFNRVRGDQAQTRRMTNSLAIPLRGEGLQLGINTINTKTDRSGQAINAAAISTEIDQRGGQASIMFSRRLSTVPLVGRLDTVTRGLAFNAYYGRDVAGSRTDQRTTNIVGSSTNRRSGTGNSWGAGVAFDRFRWVTLRARAGRLRRTNDDTIEQIIRADSTSTLVTESTSEGDTAGVEVSVPRIGPFHAISFGLRSAAGDETRPENATGSRGQGTGTGFQLETTRFYSRAFNAAATLRPFRYLNTTLTVSAARDSTSYFIKRTAFSDTKRFNWKADNRLTFWKGAALVVTYESNRSDIDRDVIDSVLVKNPQTHVDEGRRLFAEVSKPFTKSLNLRIAGEIRLDQGFYPHPTNQGFSDMDQFRTELRAVLTGNMTAHATGGVTAYYRTYNQDFLDPRQSARSKDESEYVVRPTYTWVVNERITIRQNFGLESKVIDDIFAPQNSTLNRKHYMTAALTFSPRKRLSFDGVYDYLLQDSGKYTTSPARSGRFFALEQRSKKDQIHIGANVVVIPGGKLTFSSQQTSNRVRTFTGAGAPARITEQGTLRLGFTSVLNVGELKLDARVFRLQNFSNQSTTRDVFYNSDATLTWTF
jgi:hypothetical protein